MITDEKIIETFAITKDTMDRNIYKLRAYLVKVEEAMENGGCLEEFRYDNPFNFLSEIEVNLEVRCALLTLSNNNPLDK